MRQIFENELNEIRSNISELMKMVNVAINQASDSLLEADASKAQKVIENDKKINQLGTSISEACIQSLALQQPVASDLRLLVGILHICDSLERMADFAVHISEYTLSTYPEKVFTEDFNNDIVKLSQNSNKISQQILQLYRDKDISLLDKIIETDNLTNKIYAKINKQARDTEFKGTYKNAVDLVLIVRFYERFGDHAIAVGRQYIYIITGQYSLENLDQNL
ncbi:MAG: phosphate signaling complex protein PhoU [Bifidobacteriaceae bacterium]|jgi:phosphate transport system protein|nr:phosphate signaling complex protein PhoU [Bifidobacteriaceae bacterium]